MKSCEFSVTQTILYFLTCYECVQQEIILHWKKFPFISVRKSENNNMSQDTPEFLLGMHSTEKQKCFQQTLSGKP